MTNSRAFSHAERETIQQTIITFSAMRLMETSPAEKDPSPTLDIIFYYLVIYPSFLKALGSYCCQSRGMKAPARTSISEITPFWRQKAGWREKQGSHAFGWHFYHWMADSWTIIKSGGKVMLRQTMPFVFRLNRNGFGAANEKRHS